MSRLATTWTRAWTPNRRRTPAPLLVADASHELRHPLTIATGWISRTAGRPDRPGRRDHAMGRAVQLGRCDPRRRAGAVGPARRERPLTLE